MKQAQSDSERPAERPAPRLGVTVMPEWFQCEGIEPVLDRLRAAGVTAIATSPYLMAPAAPGAGAREPPADGDAGLVRPLDRALWGRHDTWIRTAPSSVHDSARFRGLRYQPAPPGDLTHAHPRLIDDVVEQAGRRGIGVHLQVMAASPPGYRVQFCGAVDEDLCRGPDGDPHERRVDRNASLASPHVADYCAQLLADLAARYPGVQGLRIDWPEYPPYDLRSALFDFSVHAQALLRREGVDPQRYAADVLARLAGWRAAAHDAAPRGPAAVREALDRAGWSDFFSPHGSGAPLWASKRAASAQLLQRCRAALDTVDGPRRSLQPQIFPPPLHVISGFALADAAAHADAVGVKLYTMHWPMIARYWAQHLVDAADAARVDAVTAAMAGFFGFIDTPARSGAEQRYPEPHQAHPVGERAQAAKIRDAAAAAGVPVIAYAHSYGPLDDVMRRLRIATRAACADGGSGQVWINRYGYLSDAKLDAVGRVWREAQAAAAGAPA